MPAHVIGRLVDLAYDMLTEPVQFLPHVPEVLAEVGRDHRLLLLTKGDLVHQTRKITTSGLEHHFEYVEILLEKDPTTYTAGVATRRCRARPAFLMVGNSVRSDILPVLEGRWDRRPRAVPSPLGPRARRRRMARSSPSSPPWLTSPIGCGGPNEPTGAVDGKGQMVTIDEQDLIAFVERDSAGLLAAARRAEPSAAVPGCPNWDVSDLVWHIGEIHDFWGTIVRDRLSDWGQYVDHDRPSGHDATIDFAERAAAALIEALRSTPTDTPVWTWSSQNDVAFVLRRMAQKTALHRYDAEAADGAGTTHERWRIPAQLALTASTRI